MKIEVLGTGCARCHKLEEQTREALKDSGIEAELTKVEDIKKIMGYGVMAMPALVVNGEVKIAGKIPSKEEIIKLISGE